LLQKILTGNSGIDRRHFCLPNPTDVFARDAGSLNAEFERNAPELASAALTTALEQAGTAATDLDAIFVCTCTGYLCPGVSSHLAERIGARPDVYLQDLVGLGCGAALPTLHSAANFIAAHPEATVAVVAVEICSAAFFIDDDPGVLISLCLFGDGASASIWTGAPPQDRPAYRIENFRTAHYPLDRELIRFVNHDGKLKNQLHRSVPRLAARAVARLYQESQCRPDRILAHPGGRDVVEAIESELACGPLTESREVLRRYGNLSSPSVLIALEMHLREATPAARLWLTSFGAGFSCHSADLIRIDPR
jgi:alkylresorcinol/alkylpyrone synthase